MAAGADAWTAELEGFEDALLEEFVVFPGMGDEDAAVEEGGIEFLFEEGGVPLQPRGGVDCGQGVGRVG